MSSGSLSCPLKNMPIAQLTEEDVRSNLTGGRIMVRIVLAEDEIAALTAPPPLFLLVPRLAYLHTLAQIAQEHFEACKLPCFGSVRETIWFEYETLALDCQYPLGVLCDGLLGTDVPRPLTLTIHFHYCPPHVPSCTGLDHLTKVFENSLRQAVFLAHQSVNPVLAQGLNIEMQSAMAKSIANGGVDSEYIAVQKPLLCKDLEAVNSLAVQIHLCVRGCDESHEILLGVREPAPVFQQGGQPTTVLNHLYGLLPLLFTSEEGQERLADGVELLVHGIEIPLETPLYWLALHAAYLDLFVHLVLRLPPSLRTVAKDFKGPSDWLLLQQEEQVEQEGDGAESVGSVESVESVDSVESVEIVD